ncbi:MAG: TlpA disulfide reductase family protein [Bacteroidota bacterium]
MTKKQDKHFFFLLCCLLCVSTLTAQHRAFVAGQISNVHLIKQIDLQVNQKYLNNDHAVYSTDLDDDGTFAFEIELYEPQFVTMVYSRNKALLYVEPNDTLFIDSDANSFQYALQFSGKGADNNRLVKEYLAANPREMNPFKMVQFRQGTFWYANSPEMERLMMMYAGPSFIQQMDKRKLEAQTLVQMRLRELPNVSQDCRDFLNTEINYNYAYHRMLYGHVYKNRYQLTASYFDFLDEIPIQNASTGNYWYRQFLLAYISHQAMNGGNNEHQSFASQYKLAEQLLHGRPLAFLQSEYIVKGFLSRKSEEILPQYESFSRTNPYILYEEKVISAYQKAMKYAEGSPAPDIELTDRSGQSKRLSSFKGQVVYLNFWASWCKPCLRKMELMKPVQEELAQKGIIFFNVSLDRSPEAWTSIIEERAFEGIHVLAASDKGKSLMHHYNVQVLPQYYILDKGGYFAAKPNGFDPMAVRNQLLKLSQ